MNTTIDDNLPVPAVTTTTTITSTDSISQPSQQLSLQDLPEECLRLVLAHLPLIDKFRLESVCRLWQHLIYDIQWSIRFARLTSLSSSANFCGDCTHRVTNDDWCPQLMTFGSRTRQSPINMSAMESMLQKVGHSLRSVNLDLALIDAQVFEMLGEYCPNVECLSLSSSTGITDECLAIIAQNYGHRLRHVNLQCAANRALYFTNAGLKQFIANCPQLTVLFLASIRSQKSYRLSADHLDLMQNIDYLCAPLPDCMIGDDGARHLTHVQSLTGVVRLINDGIIYSQTTIQQLFENLCLLPELRHLTITTNCEAPLDRELITLAQGCQQQLRELCVRLNSITITTIEAISYFSRLEVLDLSLWKPFETGLLQLSLSPLTNCHDIHELRLANLLITDLLLDNIHVYVPNIRKLFLHNMFDMTDNSLRSLSRCSQLTHIYITTTVPNIVSDVTENGLIALLDEISTLKLFQIPIKKIRESMDENERQINR
ncbi:uncharacterized protein LOC128964952 [Oppia nitens]|uniref:uncharacterized protein LOC128964952 n=1 Tax=Oppia nitens TaxID=1686743 RepID=UPI0023DB871B|nr:uncharacterized protein LOC128964952 [Oppia nitens]